MPEVGQAAGRPLDEAVLASFPAWFWAYVSSRQSLSAFPPAEEWSRIEDKELQHILQQILFWGFFPQLFYYKCIHSLD